jgi:hypothetical protein
MNRYREGTIRMRSIFVKRPRLQLDARIRGVHNGTGRPVLIIKVTNSGQSPTEIVDARCKFFFADLDVGNRHIEVSLLDVVGEFCPPFVIDAGESVSWTTNWLELKERTRAELNLRKQTRSGIVRRLGSGRWSAAALNTVRRLSGGRSSIVVEDGQSNHYKARITPRSRRGLRGSANL